MKLQAISEKKLQSLTKKNQKFVCFGVGGKLKKCCESVRLEHNISYLTDNNEDKWGKETELVDSMVMVSNPQSYVYDEHDMILITTTYQFQVFSQIQQYPEWNKHKIAYYCPSVVDSNYIKCNRLVKYFKIQKKIALRSGMDKYVPGFDFSDNAKAIYDYLLTNGYNDDYKIVWFVHNPDEYKQNVKNVKFVSYDWEKTGSFGHKLKYFYHLLTSKYLFFTDSHFWLRYCRPGQVRVNLWHGCGFKDRKTKSGPTGQNYDYMTVTSKMYAKIHSEEFGCPIEKIVDTGLAKEDWLFQNQYDKLSDMLEVPSAKKYIFWTPTFRMAIEGLERINEYYLDSDTGLPIVKTNNDMLEINSLLEKNDAYMVIKLHPVQDNSIISKINYSRICVLRNEDISLKGLQVNQLLSRADAMISDYSSIAVDYMLLDRPIAFMLEDAERYNNSRGFVFDNIHDYLPGVELYNLEDMKKFIVDVCEDNDVSKDKRQALIKRMHTHCDGNNCKRILENVGIARE